MSRTKKIICILLILPCLLLLLCVINGLYTLYESGLYDKPGEMVQTRNGQVHVYSLPHAENGKPVYVFLDGFGGGSSYYNYKMLWEPLSVSASIITIDYLGYGMSETTNADRTVSNIVSELQDALSSTGIQGPYTFVSHSLGGFYATGYSIAYPENTNALIYLDNAIPEDVLSENDSEMASVKQTRPLYFLLKHTGLLRFVAESESPWLDTHERKASAYFEIKMLLNHAVINEIDHTAGNAKFLEGKKAPDSIPELILVSKQNNDESIEQGAATSWAAYHEDFMNQNPASTLLVLDSIHYMHYETPDIVLDAIRDFMDQ